MNVFRSEFISQGRYYSGQRSIWWNGYVAFTDDERYRHYADCLRKVAIDVPYSLTICQDSWGRQHSLTTVG